MVIAALAVGSGVAGAQERQLEPVDRFSEPFSWVRGIHEISPDSVLVADQREVALYLAEYASGTRTALGRVGEGPLEYRIPVGMHPWLGDSAAMIDLGNSKVLVIDSRGEIVRGMPSHQEGLYFWPRALDRLGRFYFDGINDLRGTKRTDPSANRAPVGYFDVLAGTADTIADLIIEGGPNDFVIAMWDVYGVSHDGWVAVARNSGEYRIDWIDPAGNLVRGPALDYELLRVSRADRDSLNRAGGNTARVGAAGAPQRPIERTLPDEFPPFRLQGVWPTHDGRVLVERHQHVAESRRLFDVFDRRGNRLATVRFPAGRNIVGTGPSGIYTVVADDDGLQWLERFEP